MRKSIEQLDSELEQLHREHALTWGRIQQLTAERNLVLRELANGKPAPTMTYQPATWNNCGFNNEIPDELEVIR